MIQTLANLIDPIHWPVPEGHHARQQPPDGAMVDHGGHPVFSTGRQRSTPGCGCTYCEAVFDDWGQQALGFAQWMAHKAKVERA